MVLVLVLSYLKQGIPDFVCIPDLMDCKLLGILLPLSLTILWEDRGNRLMHHCVQLWEFR